MLVIAIWSSAASGGFGATRVAAETPFNLILEARA